MKLTVMSYNIMSCHNYHHDLAGESSYTKGFDFDAVAETIRKYNPDIVGINEIHAQGHDPQNVGQVKELATRLGYYSYFAKALHVSDEDFYGNALLSRYPICSAEAELVPDPEVRRHPDGYYETRCLLKAKVDVAGGIDLRVIHFGLNSDEHENAVKTVSPNLLPEKCILMGDFNVQPENPVLLPIREMMVDTADFFAEPLCSYPSEAPRIKIDYMFVSPDWKVLSADIPAETTSDHRPYVSVLEID